MNKTIRDCLRDLQLSSPETFYTSKDSLCAIKELMEISGILTLAIPPYKCKHLLLALRQSFALIGEQNTFEYLEQALRDNPEIKHLMV
jgi:hypothetical protein